MVVEVQTQMTYWEPQVGSLYNTPGMRWALPAWQTAVNDAGTSTFLFGEYMKFGKRDGKLRRVAFRVIQLKLGGGSGRPIQPEGSTLSGCMAAMAARSKLSEVKGARACCIRRRRQGHRGAHKVAANSRSQSDSTATRNKADTTIAPAPTEIEQQVLQDL